MLDLYINIRLKRIEKGWTQTDLAKRMGYSDKSMIAKIEAGKVDLSQKKIIAFAEVFGCSASDLMGWNDEEEKNTSFEYNEAFLPMMLKFNQLTESNQKKLLIYLQGLLDAQND